MHVVGKEGKLPFLDQGVAQIGIIVPDLDRAMESYTKRFGIGPWHVYTYGKPLVKRMTFRGEETEYSMRVGLSYFGPMRIELIEPLDGDTIYAEFVEKHGYGVHHLGLLVDDAASAIDQAADAGIDMIQSGSGFGLDGDGCYAYLDTEAEFSVTLELIERPKRRVPPERIYPPESTQPPEAEE